MLAPRTRPGYCDYCGCWLGEPMEQDAGGVPAEEELARQKWVVEAVGELLAAAPFMLKQPRNELFAEVVSEQLNTNFGGNISALARRLHISRRTIRDWVKGTQVPQIDSLLRFCYLAHVSPLCLLDKGAAGVDPVGTGATAPQELKKNPKKHYRIFHGEQVRLALESELLTENYPPQPMSAVARRLHYDHSFLCKHFPDLCHAISDRYQAYRKKQRDERKQGILDEVRQMTYRVHKQGMYPSQERVRLLLAKPGSIKEPGALAVWHETLRELGLENGVS
jgi:transcriptional regulator with XRE-family HTH domain